MKNPGINISAMVTEDCNLRCDYCFMAHPQKHMSSEKITQLVDWLFDDAKKNNRSDVSVMYFGGEPLMNPEGCIELTEKLYAKSKETGIPVGQNTLITNSTIFNPKVEEFLLLWNELSNGNLNVQLSIDGIPEVQDAHRFNLAGEGSSTMVESTIEKFKDFCDRHKIDFKKAFSVHSVSTPESVSTQYESYRYFRNLGLERIWFMPIHEGEWTEEHVEIFEEQCVEIANQIISDVAQSQDLGVYNGYSSFKCREQRANKPCSAGENFFSVDSDGIIYPCHRFKKNDDGSMVLGNIVDGLTNKDSQDIFLEYDMLDVVAKTDCASCSNTNCKICIAANFTHNNNMMIGFPRYCEMSLAEDRIRKELKNELIEKGFLKADGSANSSCNGDCDGNCDCGDDCTCEDGTCGIPNDSEDIKDEMEETIEKIEKFITENVDEKLEAMNDVVQEARDLAAEALNTCLKVLELLEKHDIK